jgi:serine/threonine protein kinase
MTGSAPERLADYEVIQVLDRPGPDGWLLARPPARLGLDDDTVEVRVLAGRHDDERFDVVVDELRAFAGADPAHLARLYDAGWDDGLIWYATEHPVTGTLAEPGRFVSSEQRLQVVAEAARGAHALHEAGVTHGDIRPATVLLDPDRAVLAGPQLAHLLSPGRTITGSAPAEELEYCDPAGIRGEHGGRAADIWSLGLTLHRTLAQTSAYPGVDPAGGPVAAIRRMQAGGPEISTRLDPAIAEVVRACVAPDPADRPHTALALAEQIESL